MLSNTTMGYVALFVLWGNTLLVALAALARAGKLWRRRAQLEPVPPAAGAVGLAKGRVVSEGAAAELRIEQVGRWGAGEPRSVLWHDRRATSRILPGAAVELDGARVALGAEAPSQVWPSPARTAEALVCRSKAEFDEVWPTARKARGHARELALPLAEGDEVFVAGRFEDRGGELVLGGTEGAPLLVSAVEPRALLLRHASFLALFFVPAVLLGSGVVTAIALWPPVLESTLSQIGGLACFVYFLLVLPAGTSARDHTLLPHELPLRGKWVDPEPGSATATAAGVAAES